MRQFKPVVTAENVTRAVFENDIKPLGQPVVLKGLVSHWPCVAASRTSSHALGEYLKRHDSGATSLISICPPKDEGRLFYDDTVTGVNFTGTHQSISQLVNWLLEQGPDTAEARYLQAVLIAAAAPTMLADLDMPLLDGKIQPRVWIGNTLRTQTHFDRPANIACHVAGEKVVTLFPPEQLTNLYVGPLDMTPGGVPISMTSLENPDFKAHPRFAQALETAQQTRLEPGDALYMPSYWWHHIQTTGPLNMLVNYWWNDTRPDAWHPMAALYLAALSIRQLPEDQRRLWKTMLDYYIFDSDGDPVAHLPPSVQGAFGRDISAEAMQLCKEQFRQRYMPMLAPKA